MLNLLSLHFEKLAHLMTDLVSLTFYPPMIADALFPDRARTADKSHTFAECNDEMHKKGRARYRGGL